MIRFERLTRLTELQAFVDGFVDACRDKPLEIRFPPVAETYTHYHRVVGVYEGDRLVGGYVLNLVPERVFSGSAPETRDGIIASLGGPAKVCELVSIWRARDYSNARFTAKVWPRIVLDTLALRRPIVFGCALSGHGMLKTYRLLEAKVVIQGKSDYELTVFYYKRWQMVATFALGFVKHFFRKLTGTSGRKKTLRPSHG